MPHLEPKTTATSQRAEAFEAKRMDILHKAAIVFAECGYHQTSVNSLADRLGVSKPVLYYYAKNKDDLLYQCGEIARSELRKAVDQNETAEISGDKRLKNFLSSYAEIMCGDFGRCLALVDPRVLSPGARGKDAAQRREVEAAVRKIIREGQRDGSISACDPVIVARALFGAFNGIPRWFRADGALDAREVANAFFAIFMTGLSNRDLAAPIAVDMETPRRRRPSSTSC